MPDLDYIDVVCVEPTAINQVERGAMATEQYFDLHGRKVSDSKARGIVVSDSGKKYVK